MKNILRNLSLGLVAGCCLNSLAHAACTNNPDCTALGYTKTSCPAGNLIIRCPFDTAKLKCIPSSCENIGKKTCGDMCAPSGFSGCCSNADCAAGQTCDTAVHTCYSICAVGDIYYSDKTCSANLISGKTPIGVVGKISNGGKNGIVVEKNHSFSQMEWGCYGMDLSCITNMPGSYGGSNPELRADYNGKSNTACIVQNNCKALDGSTNGAGVYCNSRSVEGVTGWYLPAGGELYDTMIANRTTVNTGLGKISGATKMPSAGENYYYWSSSEYVNRNVWLWEFYYGGWYYLDKNFNSNARVRCVLAF